MLVSNLIHAWAEAHHYRRSRIHPVPAAVQPRTDRGLVRLGLVDRTRAREQGVAVARGLPSDRALNYPLAPLRCEPRPPMLNVLLVVIDAMRADALTPVVAPNTFELAQDAVRFDGNFSGGNSSRVGMFSLFYGLPGTYWDAFASLTQHAAMDLFQRYGYQLGCSPASPSTARPPRSNGPGPYPQPSPRDSFPYPGSSGWDRP